MRVAYGPWVFDRSVHFTARNAIIVTQQLYHALHVAVAVAVAVAVDVAVAVAACIRTTGLWQVSALHNQTCSWSSTIRP